MLFPTHFFQPQGRVLAVVNIKWAVLHKVNHHCYLRFIKRKVNANREQNLSSLLEQLCRDAALLTQKYKDFLKRQNVWRIFINSTKKIPQGLRPCGTRGM